MIIHNIQEGEYTENKEILQELFSLDNIEDVYCRYLKKLGYTTEDYKGWNLLKTKFLHEWQSEEFRDSNINGSGMHREMEDSMSHGGIHGEMEDSMISGIHGEIHTKSSDSGINNTLKNNDSKQHVATICKEQLKTTLSALKFNPKSYETWHHRYFINKFIKTEEKHLILLLLEADQRNLHCWNYITKLYPDLDFIPKNASNYSYLHYVGGFDSISCIYTDLYDQAMWFYFFVSEEKKLLENDFYVRKYKNEIAVIFKDVFQGTINVNNQEKQVLVPAKYVTINSTCKLTDIIVNGKLYILEKGQQSSQYYEDILDLESDCIYNEIFNYQISRGKKPYNGIFEKYVSRIEEEQYEVFTIKK